MFYKFIECSRIFFLRKYDSLYESYESLEYFTIYKPANFCQFSFSSVFWSEVKWNKKWDKINIMGTSEKSIFPKKFFWRRIFIFMEDYFS